MRAVIRDAGRIKHRAELSRQIADAAAVVRRPAVVRAADGTEKIDIRSMAYLALSYDHRLVDGADAARYLSTMKTRLEAADFAAEVGG